MDLSARDYDKLISLLEEMESVCEWQAGVNSTADMLMAKVRACLRVLRSYVDDDSEITTTDMFLVHESLSNQLIDDDEEEYTG